MATSASLNPSVTLFEAVVQKDYDSLVRLFATNARNAVISYLSMKHRWASVHGSESYKSEEKLDEYLQQFSYNDTSNHNNFQQHSPLSAARQEDDTSYYYLLQELAALLSLDGSGIELSKERLMSSAATNFCLSEESERLVFEASSLLSDSRPPSNFVVYNHEGATEPSDNADDSPPIFDGSVANATPPPLGGASAGGASGGTGTILHLICAMDQPLALALLLCMGADARASHTAFRRLVIHEAACNGSINCLKLLLELGQKYTKEFEKDSNARKALTQKSRDCEMPLFPDISARTFDAAPAISMNFRAHFLQRPPGFAYKEEVSTPPPTTKSNNYIDFLTRLYQFKEFSYFVKLGKMTELDAARALLVDAWLPENTRMSLMRSCAFKKERIVSRSFLRPQGCADGHGNTPLHWAAFKNETECVSVLLQYHADANARAHPSGWTPLHDAAYSDSSESIELLIDRGAEVDARANSGATPLCFAAQEDAANAAHLLLMRGADLSARCAGGPSNEIGQHLGMNHPHSRFSGYTPLHYCAHYNANNAAKVLLKHSSAQRAMETPDLSERLPIHVAVARGSSDVLRELLHAGARVDIRPGTNNGRSPSPQHQNTVTATVAATIAFPSISPARRPPSPERPETPSRRRAAAGDDNNSSPSSTTPVSSPVLRSMIPSQPITSSKPWNCLSQQAIDECRDLISKAEQSWAPDRHLLFTPSDRRAVMELLRVGKRLEQQGSGIFIDLWPLVLSFCGRGWFEKENDAAVAAAAGAAAVALTLPRSVAASREAVATEDDDDYLALPTLTN